MQIFHDKFVLIITLTCVLMDNFVLVCYSNLLANYLRDQISKKKNIKAKRFFDKF